MPNIRIKIWTEYDADDGTDRTMLVRDRDLQIDRQGRIEIDYHGKLEIAFPRSWGIPPQTFCFSFGKLVAETKKRKTE
jgi:hypothetical protein